RLAIRDRRYRGMTLEDTFTEIYRSNRWGGAPGELFSGRGSAHPKISEAYCGAVMEFLRALPPEQRSVVDLGCGDFRIGEQFVNLCSAYVGIDIVDDLIDELSRRGYPSHVTFNKLNIVTDPLPPGNICIVRQVLQHLSNAEIQQVLIKL